MKCRLVQLDRCLNTHHVPFGLRQNGRPMAMPTRGGIGVGLGVQVSLNGRGPRPVGGKGPSLTGLDAVLLGGAMIPTAEGAGDSDLELDLFVGAHGSSSRAVPLGQPANFDHRNLHMWPRPGHGRGTGKGVASTEVVYEFPQVKGVSS